MAHSQNNYTATDINQLDDIDDLVANQGGNIIKAKTMNPDSFMEV